MAFTLRLSTENAAFESDPCSEVVRVLLDVVDVLNKGGTRGQCRDANGNKVGAWSLTDGKRS